MRYGTCDIRVAGSLSLFTGLLAAGPAAAQPAILVPPMSRSLSLGASAGFQVLASGRPPLRYQWRRNGSDIQAATSSVLVLADIQLADRGAYTVLVTDAAGSTESEPALLAVDPPFTHITAGSVLTDLGPSGMCAWGDYDGGQEIRDTGREEGVPHGLRATRGWLGHGGRGLLRRRRRL
jgi:hypothetical protein